MREKKRKESNKINKLSGERLKECLKESNVKQNALAKKLNYTPQYIGQIVKGEKRLTKDLAYEIEKLNIFDVSWEYLTCEIDYKTPAEKNLVEDQGKEYLYNQMIEAMKLCDICMYVCEEEGFRLNLSPLSAGENYLHIDNSIFKVSRSDLDYSVEMLSTFANVIKSNLKRYGKEVLHQNTFSPNLVQNCTNEDKL